MGFWSGELVWNGWQSCLKWNMVKGLFVGSYRNLLCVLAWPVVAYFKNCLVINHSSNLILCLVPFHQNNKKGHFLVFHKLFDSHRQLLCHAAWNTETEILISPSLFFHQLNCDAFSWVAYWCQHKREKNEDVVWPLLKQQNLWLNILLEYEVLLGRVEESRRLLIFA